ncbi:DUF4371 domain-containing protein [Trichonephila clavipes]|nr:DUF4371 domain-containing protein [Trichonephila clavipes]
MKDRILKLAENVTGQQKNDINSTPIISLCLDESIDITKSARLAVFARYCAGNIIKEELIAITSLLTTTEGTDICTAAQKIYRPLGTGGSKFITRNLVNSSLSGLFWVPPAPRPECSRDKSVLLLLTEAIFVT